jgi:hypothetical protein
MGKLPGQLLRGNEAEQAQNEADWQPFCRILSIS